MKWYFASRTKHRSKIIEIADFLNNEGQTVVSDWIYSPGLAPFDEHIAEVEALTQDVIKSILDADIFVLISDLEGTDMLVELGIALAKSVSGRNIKIYVVGSELGRSVMQLHSSVQRVADLKEVFEYEKINIDNFEIPVFNQK